MKLTVNFSNLQHSVELMQPDQKGNFKLELQETQIEKLDIELAEGKDVELKDVSVDSGLLSYKGRQVLLYIKDHGQSAQSAIDNPYTGRKFHVADCATLRGMREQGRFERYVVTNDISGNFLVSGYGVEGKAKLRVCQNCLSALNYQGGSSGGLRNQILPNFNMGELFSTYSSFFPHMPARQAETAQTGYTEDWTKVSSHYRVEKGFSCEQCNVNLKSYRGLLHVHHINGVKSDNRASNFKALCIDCHSKQPLHTHMALKHSERQLINQLRKDQGLLESLDAWSELFDYTDPGVHGVLHACKRQGYKMPQVGFYVEDQFGDLVAKVELAWPKHKFGIAISSMDIEEATQAGWHITSVAEFLEGHRTNGQNLRY